ncbi:branched-chain amino acid ABC transporter permease [Xenophilus azovorans]|uniref:branched-chain amino acid ABC transporter permease n=1 Tax=Xenophilus azovorans TaxID=151755 RepID=UPI00056F2E2C|nr:branched-chain amino acid ABC transporter permease [Xenophilus azovorans]
MNVFELTPQMVSGQLLVGLINGSFYALLSLGLALIFGMLRVINFAHGALYMLGAFVAWWLLTELGVPYGIALVLSPLIVGAFGVLLERVFLARLQGKDPLYGLLLTFGLALIVEGSFRHFYGTSGKPYPMPEAFRGAFDLGFMVLPYYRAWVVVASLAVCIGTWSMIEKTTFGAKLRAANANPTLVQAIGINVPLLITFTYTLGAGLAALAGTLAAPIYQVSPLMGQHMIIVVFAIVVIGGMGSMLGAIAAGYLLGLCEGVARIFYPEAAGVVVFLIMALVLLLRPTGLFGRQ